VRSGGVVMGLVAIVENGVWTTIDTGQPSAPANHVSQKNNSHEVEVDTRSDIDKIASHLGQAVRLAQHLNPTDARRARDLMHAAQGAMSAMTYLPADDQKLFERSLRGGHE
jgi:hypothetical protein